jgi:ubiquinol-cytochrome c reductase cytochrome b subunit
MLGLASDPTHERYYRSENDRMPSFAKSLAKPATHTVSVRELSLIVDWLHGDYYESKRSPPVLPHEPEYARKAVELARVLPPSLAPPTGVAANPRQQAERLFRLNCAACHSHVDDLGRGIAAANPSAPNLHGFASRQWLTGLLDPKRIGGPAYFGNTSHAKGDMFGFVNDTFAGEPSEEVLQQRQQIIAALSAEAKLPAQAEADMAAEQDGTLEAGRTAIAEAAFDGGSCIDCHKFHDNGDLGVNPDLTGYGSLEWLKQMIADPTGERHYPSGNDRMPAFATGGILTDEEIELLAKWLRGEMLD